MKQLKQYIQIAFMALTALSLGLSLYSPLIVIASVCFAAAVVGIDFVDVVYERQLARVATLELREQASSALLSKAVSDLVKVEKRLMRMEVAVRGEVTAAE